METRLRLKVRLLSLFTGVLTIAFVLAACGSQEPFDLPSVSSRTAQVVSAEEEPETLEITVDIPVEIEP